MDTLPLDLTRQITSQLDDRTLFLFSAIINLRTHVADQSWWFLRVRHLLDTGGHSDKRLTYQEGSWQEAYYILYPIISSGRLPYSVYNESDNVLAASCLIDLGCEITHSALSQACSRGSTNLVKFLLPHLNPNETTPWTPVCLVAAKNSGQKHIIEILLADTRLEIDRRDVNHLQMKHLRTDKIISLLRERGWQ